MIEWIPLAVVGLVAVGGFVAVRKSAEAERARLEQLRDWAGRNGFRLDVRPAPIVRLRVTGEDEVPFVLEARHTTQGQNEILTEWVASSLSVPELELIVVGKELNDFFHSKLGQMLVSMAGSLTARQGPARTRALSRLAALSSFGQVPMQLGSGRFVALARVPEKWPELLSREVVALLESWPKTKQAFDAPTLTLDSAGLTVEVGQVLNTPEKLHHMIRIGAAMARGMRGV